LWFRVLGRTVYRRLVVVERRLDEPIPLISAEIPAVVSLLTDADVEQYASFRPDTEPSEIRRRLRAGHQCFVVRSEGLMVHAGWAATTNAWVQYLGREFPLAPGDVYQFDSYTAATFRGLDLAAARVTRMAQFFREAGARRLLAAVWPENTQAFRPLAKAGYRPVGIIGSVRLARWRHHFYRRTDTAPAPAYWDQVMEEHRQASPLVQWRAYMRRIYTDLMRRWVPTSGAGRGLKTDLFEEAVSAHHVLRALGPGSIGLDCSPATVLAARERLRRTGGGHLLVVADLRAIPLRASTVGHILAGSSLDHFPDKADIATSLKELARVLRPGGTLVATFDNPHNPAVWLRNRLPFVWLNRLGLVPYYVGQTYGRAEGRARLEALGFAVTDVTAVAHAVRAPAIALIALAERFNAPRVQRLLGRTLDAFERFERWPTRYRTGYYLAFRAEKRGSTAAPSLDPGCDSGLR
jgi:SAM-dependent methyltransferase